MLNRAEIIGRVGKSEVPRCQLHRGGDGKME